MGAGEGYEPASLSHAELHPEHRRLREYRSTSPRLVLPPTPQRVLWEEAAHLGMAMRLLVGPTWHSGWE